MNDIEKRAANAMARDMESYLWELWDDEKEEIRDRWLERIKGMNYAFRQIDLDVKAVYETDSGVFFPIAVSVGGVKYDVFNKARARWEKARKDGSKE